MKKTCPQCKEEFSKPYSESIKNWFNRHIYCSKKCYIDSMKGRDPFTDKTRNKIAWNKGKKGLKGDKNPNWKGGEMTIICKKCRGRFKARQYRRSTVQFCSRLCKTNNSNQGKTPESMRIRKSLAYKLWRTSVFERDNYVCVHCGIKNGLGKTVYFHADHIKPFALFPELRLNVNNGRTLCVPCHKKTRTFGRKSIYRSSVASAQQA